ncbi:restriction endonuclease [Bacillus solitudinis]|uniref:restriction endonuclease n=1 Tax=Bacillus solitudinis TaxID=2014074 RepID=UPI000C23E40C|nr:restriction endonuclease [Bacillus solitudinis]
MIEFFSSHLYIAMVAIAFILLLTFWLVYKKNRRKRYDLSKMTLDDIDKMDGYEFEDYLYVLLRAIGYEQIYQTKKSRDYGADLLFIDRTNQKTVVQAKRYLEKVGLSAVQEVYAAQAFYEANSALVITSAKHISEPCLKLATAANVKIIDREDLGEIIHAFKKKNFERAQEIVEVPDEPVGYTSEDSLTANNDKRGLIQAGDYYYKI